MSKQIKIIKCSDPLMWYNDFVGKTVPYVRSYDDCYLSKEPSGYANIVRLEDGILVDDVGEEVKKCCNNDCNQGRSCPSREQANESLAQSRRLVAASILVVGVIVIVALFA